MVERESISFCMNIINPEVRPVTDRSWKSRNIYYETLHDMRKFILNFTPKQHRLQDLNEEHAAVEELIEHWVK